MYPTDRQDGRDSPEDAPADGFAPPLRFKPIFKPALWGGNRLRDLFGAPPAREPTGEAWVLSDFATGRAWSPAARWPGPPSAS